MPVKFAFTSSALAGVFGSNGAGTNTSSAAFAPTAALATAMTAMRLKWFLNFISVLLDPFMTS